MLLFVLFPSFLFRFLVIWVLGGFNSAVSYFFYFLFADLNLFRSTVSFIKHIQYFISYDITRSGVHRFFFQRSVWALLDLSMILPSRPFLFTVSTLCTLTFFGDYPCGPCHTSFFSLLFLFPSHKHNHMTLSAWTKRHISDMPHMPQVMI